MKTAKPNIGDLRAFVEVAAHENFGHAAEALSVTQGALSRRIQKLEEIIGDKLLNRTSRHVELTRVGAAFLPSAKRVVRHMDRAMSDLYDFVDTRAGVVSVSSTRTVASTVMPRAVARLRELHPDSRIRILDGIGNVAHDFVVSGEAEFGVVMTDRVYQGVSVEKIIDDPYVLAMHQNHPLAEHKSLTWTDLKDQTVFRMAPSTGNGRVLVGVLDQYGISLDWAVEAQHVSTIIALIERNEGVCVVPRITLERFSSKRVVTRPIGDPPITRGLGIVTIPGRILTPSASELLDIVIEELRQFGGEGVVVAA